MPLLKRETEVFPQDLFDLPSDVFPWWVAHTRSRREKAVARHLEQNGVPFYLPQRERRVRRGGRTLTSYLPLFGGYVFFRGLSRERLEALRSQFLVGVLAVEAQELLTGELARLRSLQGLGASLALGAPLTPGEAVKITDGPFRGYRGIVISEKGRQRLVVSVTMLARAVFVEFEKGIVTPVEARQAQGTA